MKFYDWHKLESAYLEEKWNNGNPKWLIVLFLLVNGLLSEFLLSFSFFLDKLTREKEKDLEKQNGKKYEEKTEKKKEEKKQRKKKKKELKKK